MTNTFPTDLAAKNLILIMKEKEGADRLPVDYAALSLKNFLATETPSIQTEIHEPGNCHEFLRLCGAFGPLTYDVHYFFTLSHAWPGGLVLDYDPDSEDDAIKAKLESLYGREITIGQDDETEFRTYQMRLSNLHFLPDESVKRMRHIFRNAKGVFLAGCNTAVDHEDAELSMAQALADVIQRPVFGAAYSSKTLVGQHELHETPGTIGVETPPPRLRFVWEQRDVARADVHNKATLSEAEEQNLPLLIVPTFWSQSGLEMLFDFEWLINPTPETDDLLAVYKKVLQQNHPAEVK